MAEGRRVYISKLQLDMQTGVGLSSGQGSDPQVMLRVSRDGGYTWGPILSRSMGLIGHYAARVIWWRLGIARNFAFEWSGSDPTQLAILDAYLDGEQGEN